MAKVVIIYYQGWPGMGIKAVVSGDEAADQAIRLLMHHRRLANVDCPYEMSKFVKIYADVDQVEIAGRRWRVNEKGYVEIKDAPSPEVQAVQG